MFTWGAGSKGQLGLSDGTVNKVFSPVKSRVISNAIDSDCGQYFTVVLMENGEIVGFGDNKYMQLLQDAKISKVLQPQVINSFNGKSGQISCGWTHVVFTCSGQVSVKGRNNYHQHGDITALTGPVTVMSGSEHCLCITNTGHLLAWGWNEHGNCGTGDTSECISAPTRVQFNKESVTKVFVGSAHCFAFTDK